MTKKLFLFAALALPPLAHAATARYQRDSGNADGRQKIAGDQIEATQRSGAMAYSVYTRRDAFTNGQTLLNAAALAYAGVASEEHHFGFGLGSHYRHERGERQKAPGEFYPALGFFWSHPRFRLDLSGTEKLTKIALSALFAIALPVEFNTDFEALASQPYRWSVNAFVFVARYGGLIAGIEPLAERARAGFWLAPTESLRMSALARFSSGETFWEFALSFALDNPQQGHLLSELPANADEQVEEKTNKVQSERERKKPKQVPAFALLVKWGLAPTEALKFTREKDACALSNDARKKLAAKNWICHEDA